MIQEAPSEVQAEIDAMPTGRQAALAEKAREPQAPFVQLGPGGDYARPIDLGRPWRLSAPCLPAGRRLRSCWRRLFGRKEGTC